ncbi:MAG: glucose-6-phosphate dehydrogenase [Myxococcales bacterium]|nr:glucose-6-phosphate dehydrogenase [Myxococcales bacterium]
MIRRMGEKVGTTQLVIFGASGDLTKRKLIPALVRLEAEGQLHDQVVVIGVSRSVKSDQEFCEHLAGAIPEEFRGAFESLSKRIHYLSADVKIPSDVEKLGAALDAMPGGESAGRLYYLSLKPELFGSTLTILGEAGMLRMADQHSDVWRRVVVEKPFGHDQESARALNTCMHRYLREQQIYRIDHYLGKETVQNILGFRFHNTIFEPLWNSHHIELVQITVAEDLGVEKGRAGFYDESGAMRDVVQNHMLQLLALVAMEAPATLDGDDIRNQKVEVLRALHIPDRADIAEQSVRARYTTGKIGDSNVIGYLEEEGVPENSQTETYVALRAEINNWRWNSVPFLLRHGKRLGSKFTEIKVQFRMPPVQLFNRPDGLSASEFRKQLRDGNLCQLRPNVLTISIQPSEALSLSFGVKRPGASMDMTPAKLSFNYEDVFKCGSAPAYQRLLLDALNGDPTLFLRSDEIDASWCFSDEFIKVWAADDAPPICEYAAGSWGPKEADALFEGCEGGWSRG